MKLTDVFLRRPVLAMVVSLLIVIAGLRAVRTLNVRQYPRIESATVTVRTVYVGANAELVRGYISARVDQVRADLPPEAEVPAIQIQPSDAQVASMYLSFASDVLQPNQVTD